mmetsp:Transcript_202/g.506  ORF Transcript_202/g.506 Transcript_202/m.506 type:complete len:659 (-) Transcript_202:44-2020(-)
MRGKSSAVFIAAALSAAMIFHRAVAAPTSFHQGFLSRAGLFTNVAPTRRRTYNDAFLHLSNHRFILLNSRQIGKGLHCESNIIPRAHFEDNDDQLPERESKRNPADLSFIRPRNTDEPIPPVNKVFSANIMKQSGKERLARAAASLKARREKGEVSKKSSMSLTAGKESTFSYLRKLSDPIQQDNTNYDDSVLYGGNNSLSGDLVGLTKKIDQKILSANWSRSTHRRRVNDNNPGTEGHVQHATDSMQSLLGYNHFEGDWSERNSTTYHVVIIFGKPLINDQVTIEFANRIRTLAKLLKEEPEFRPSLICFTGGVSPGNYVSDASAGYLFFRHLCASQSIPINDIQTKMWVDPGSSDEREAMEVIASELWRNHIKLWLHESPAIERLNRHYGVEWTVLERKIDIHFTLVSTEYHLCNMNDVHHRSPGKSFLQPLVSLRGLVASDRWNNEDFASDSGYYSDTLKRKSTRTGQTAFRGIENSVDTTWSFHYGTYPFLHGNDEAVVFLGQCYLLGEELTPLLVNMKGVVEQTEFFQRDNYLLLSSIRRSLVSLVEALYTEKGQSIRAGVIKHFQSHGSNRLTKEDVKIIVVLESALLNLGRCIDLVKPAGLLVSSVPASTWSRALDALEKSMNNIISVCDPDQPLEATEWGKLCHEDGNVI